jgi:hypothetical protein
VGRSDGLVRRRHGSVGEGRWLRWEERWLSEEETRVSGEERWLNGSVGRRGCSIRK